MAFQSGFERVRDGHVVHAAAGLHAAEQVGADVALAAACGVAQVEDHVVQVEVGDLERADLAGPGGERDGHVDGDAGLVGHGVADGLELFGRGGRYGRRGFGLVGRGPDARVALDDGVAAVGQVGGLAHDPVEEDVRVAVGGGAAQSPVEEPVDVADGDVFHAHAPEVPVEALEGEALDAEGGGGERVAVPVAASAASVPVAGPLVEGDVGVAIGPFALAGVGPLGDACPVGGVEGGLAFESFVGLGPRGEVADDAPPVGGRVVSGAVGSDGAVGAAADGDVSECASCDTPMVAVHGALHASMGRGFMFGYMKTPRFCTNCPKRVLGEPWATRRRIRRKQAVPTQKGPMSGLGGWAIQDSNL